MPSNALLTILTEANALAVLVTIIASLCSGLAIIVGWQIRQLITNMDHLDKTVTQNNIYQKQHFDMLKEHKNKIEDHHTRITILENKNGKA